jgi:hypothetical protein
MTTKTKELFMKYDMLLCTDHLGYADAESMELSSSRVLDFLGLRKPTKRERDEWLAELGRPMDCEEC